MNAELKIVIAIVRDTEQDSLTGHFWTLRTLASQDIRNSTEASGTLGGGSGVR